MKGVYVWIVIKGNMNYEEEMSLVEVCSSKMIAVRQCEKDIESSFPEVAAFPEKYEMVITDDKITVYNLRNKITGEFSNTFWEIKSYPVNCDHQMFSSNS
jgi:hypothetical protein